jgi:hypothetical protein
MSLTVSTSDDVKRQGSNFKMATLLEERTKEKVRSVIRFCEQNITIF